MLFVSGRKIVTLLMELKSQVQAIAHHQQQIMMELGKSKNGVKSVPKLPEGVLLPLTTAEQLTVLEKRLKRHPDDKQQLVHTVYTIV